MALAAQSNQRLNLRVYQFVCCCLECTAAMLGSRHWIRSQGQQLAGPSISKSLIASRGRVYRPRVSSCPLRSNLTSSSSSGAAAASTTAAKATASGAGRTSSSSWVSKTAAQQQKRHGSRRLAKTAAAVAAGDAAPPVEATYHAPQPHQLVLDVAGQQVRADVDDALMFQCHDQATLISTSDLHAPHLPS